jgi:HD-like signal output (HDOD) protein
VAAKILARKRGVDPKLLEEYFAAGLLHDIGKIPLNAVLPREYLLTIKSADIGKVPLARAEAEYLGVTHTEIGGRVFRAWRITGSLEDVVIHHHNSAAYAGEHRDLLYSIMAANYFASLMEIGFSGDCHPEKPAPLVWETLGISGDIFDDIRSIVDEEMAKAHIFLNL